MEIKKYKKVVKEDAWRGNILLNYKSLIICADGIKMCESLFSSPARAQAGQF